MDRAANVLQTSNGPKLIGEQHLRPVFNTLSHAPITSRVEFNSNK